PVVNTFLVLPPLAATHQGKAWPISCWKSRGQRLHGMLTFCLVARQEDLSKLQVCSCTGLALPQPLTGIVCIFFQISSSADLSIWSMAPGAGLTVGRYLCRRAPGLVFPHVGLRESRHSK